MTGPGNDGPTPAQARISQTIAELGDWRGDVLDEVRRLIHDADPDIVEEVKWVKPSNPAGVPTWTHDGIICTGEIYKDKVKLTFAYGAALPDPAKLFNSSLGGTTRRAIDIRESGQVDPDGLKDLIRAAVERNTGAAPTHLPPHG